MPASDNLNAPQAAGTCIPIARMRSLYRVDEVGAKLGKLPHKEHETLRTTYQRMLDKGPERFQVKPSGLPVMDHLYDELPNFAEVLDDVRRQLALCEDSRDALEITPLLLLGPPGIGQDTLCAGARRAARHGHGLSLDELDDRRAGCSRVRRASGKARGPARCSRRWSTASTRTR